MKYLINGKEAPKQEYDAYQELSNGAPSKERRNRIAEGFAFALVQHMDAHNAYNPDEERAGMCRLAVKLADALIAELDK
jgi:hypothetical protein